MHMDVVRWSSLPGTKNHGSLIAKGFTAKNEKALRQTQTLRAGCSKAEPKIFTPPQTPFPGARDS